jgi:hypothetical protein
MFEETEQLKQKLEEMLRSNDKEWANVVMVTMNALYRQFGLEQQCPRQILPLATREMPHPQVGRICRRRSQSRPGRHISESELAFLTLR